MRSDVEDQLRSDWRRLHNYAVSLGTDSDRARDLLQMVAERALSSQNIPEEKGAIRPWLFRILRNLWIDEYRRSKHHAFDAPIHELPAQSCSFEDTLIAEITVRQGMARIEAIHREIIELIDLAGFSYAEVSGILEIPIGTVMSRLSRARLALLEAIRTDNVRLIGSRRPSP